jgi:hypothetical protein
MLFFVAQWNQCSRFEGILLFCFSRSHIETSVFLLQVASPDPPMLLLQIHIRNNSFDMLSPSSFDPVFNSSYEIVSTGSLIFFLHEGIDLVVRKAIPFSWMPDVGLMHCCGVYRNNLLTMLLV